MKAFNLFTVLWLSSQTVLRLAGNFPTFLCRYSATAAHLAQAAPPRVGASRTALVTVVDPRGRSIVDVDSDDFVVRETGQARDVLSVRVADYPVALVLDNGPASSGDFDAIRAAAARFARRVGARPLAVAMADPPGLAAGFDADRATVLTGIERMRPGGSGASLLDAVVSAARAVQESGSAFSAIVVLSAHVAGAAPAEILTPLLDSGTSLDAVVNVAATGGGPAAAILRDAADRTHGQFTTIFSSASYQVALDRLADRLAPELMLEYVVPVGSSSGSDVQLGIRIPGARVLGRAVR